MEGSILTAWVAPHHKEMTHMFRFRPVACPWGEPNTQWWWCVGGGRRLVVLAHKKVTQVTTDFRGWKTSRNVWVEIRPPKQPDKSETTNTLRELHTQSRLF